jgi:hypothetical protein
MRPIELIHSIQQMAIAEEMQLRPLHDPYNAGGDLAQRDLRNFFNLQDTIVGQSDPKQRIESDQQERPKSTPSKKRPKNPNRPASEETPDSPKHVDFFA